MDTQISHFRLTRKLGAGTYGEVHEAVHVHDEELRVAVKIVAPALVQDPRFVEALKRECRQLDKLDHPNIVRFRDLVVNDGQVAMVLELLTGQDLHDRLAGGPLPVETAVPVLEALLEGLAYAHARGVLHRDIKPGNVYWCDDGRIKLLDFGIARAADGTQATKTGQMVGTFDYMAPERFDGQHGSAASDVYAAGLIGWELLTGKAACPEGEPGRKVKWHLVNGIGTPAQVLAAIPGCPPWLAEVLAKLAATEVADRPADGTAALALLREARAASGGSAEPRTRPPPPGTVLAPGAAASVPPVAASLPPVAASLPPRSVPPVSGSTTNRSAPPETVLGPVPTNGPGAGMASAPPSLPPPAPPAPLETAPVAPSAPSASSEAKPASRGAAVKWLAGSAALALVGGGGWFVWRGPSVASIELEPAGDLSFIVGQELPAPKARPLGDKGQQVRVEVACSLEAPGLLLREGKLSATEAASGKLTCIAGEVTTQVNVRALGPYKSKSTGYEMRPILGGTFTMGSPVTESGRWDNEKQHEVTLTHAYLMGVTEVTQAQWEAVMKSNPSEKFAYFDNNVASDLIAPTKPVQNINWCDAIAFANALSDWDGLTRVYGLPGNLTAGLDASACKEHHAEVVINPDADGYRLPTEAEWEHAARGGTTDVWAGTNIERDLCKIGNVPDLSAKAKWRELTVTTCDDQQPAIAPVASYAANAFGLHDMTGNVSEWTWDTYIGYDNLPELPLIDPSGPAPSTHPARTARDSAFWYSGVDSIRVTRIADRKATSPGNRTVLFGLRLARTIPNADSPENDVGVAGFAPTGEPKDAP